MIQLRRSVRGPVEFHAHAMRRKVSLKLTAEMVGKGHISAEFWRRNAYWKGAKKWLLTESGGCCSYCESYVPAVGHGDVDHYRPKALYWWLAYSYHNLLFTCQICNQYKSDQFPIEALKRMRGPSIKRKAGKSLVAPLKLAEFSKTFTPAEKNERAVLLNPYSEDPLQYFAWKVDRIQKEITIAPRKPSYGTRVRATDAVLGLNRDELKRRRFVVFEILATLRSIITESEASELAAEKALKMFAGLQGSEYRGMVAFFACKWNLVRRINRVANG